MSPFIFTNIVCVEPIKVIHVRELSKKRYMEWKRRSLRAHVAEWKGGGLDEVEIEVGIMVSTPSDMVSGRRHCTTPVRRAGDGGAVKWHARPAPGAYCLAGHVRYGRPPIILIPIWCMVWLKCHVWCVCQSPQVTTGAGSICGLEFCPRCPNFAIPSGTNMATAGTRATCHVYTPSFLILMTIDFIA